MLYICSSMMDNTSLSDIILYESQKQCCDLLIKKWAMLGKMKINTSTQCSIKNFYTEFWVPQKDFYQILFDI